MGARVNNQRRALVNAAIAALLAALMGSLVAQPTAAQMLYVNDPAAPIYIDPRGAPRKTNENPADLSGAERNLWVGAISMRRKISQGEEFTEESYRGAFSRMLLETEAEVGGLDALGGATVELFTIESSDKAQLDFKSKTARTGTGLALGAGFLSIGYGVDGGLVEILDVSHRDTIREASQGSNIWLTLGDLILGAGNTAGSERLTRDYKITGIASQSDLFQGTAVDHFEATRKISSRNYMIASGDAVFLLLYQQINRDPFEFSVSGADGVDTKILLGGSQEDLYSFTSHLGEALFYGLEFRDIQRINPAQDVTVGVLRLGLGVANMQVEQTSIEDQTGSADARETIENTSLSMIFFWLF